MARKKVLICGGATGFIGRNALLALEKNPDYEVFGTYFTRDPLPSLTESFGARLSRADLRVKEDVERVVAGKDIVIQAAATTSGAKDTFLKPYYHVTDNAIINSLLFRACHENKVQRFIFFSCTNMYANHEEPVKESDFDYQLTDRYFGGGWTKVYLEKMCEFYSRLGNTRFTVIRHSNVYGPFDKYDLERSHVFGATVTKVMTAPDYGKVTVWGDGSEVRDLLYIDDLIDFVEKALARETSPFELVNVGSGEFVSIRDLVHKMIEHSGKNLTIEFDKTKPSIPFKVRLNANRAQRLFGWSKKTSLDEGIAKTLDWYRCHYLQKQPVG